MADATVSALPAVARQKMVQLAAMQDAANPPAPEPVAPEPPAAPVAATPEPERVTLTREELNDLRASAERAATAQGRAEQAALRAEELQRRLTELETAAKANPVPATPAPASEAPQYTPEELEQYGDSKDFITKVAQQVATNVINTRMAELETRLKGIETTTQGVAKTVQTHTTSTFYEKVQAKVPKMQAIISHKNWGDFLDSIEPMTGATYETVLQHNVQGQRLDQVANIYNLFESKYMQEATPPAGYDGANPSGGAVNQPSQPVVAGKLKQSDRKKASADYIKGIITWDQLEEVNKKFDAADKIGNIDYNA